MAQWLRVLALFQRTQVQFPQGSSQLSITPVLGDPILSSGLFRDQAYMQTSTHKSKSFFKRMWKYGTWGNGTVVKSHTALMFSSQHLHPSSPQLSVTLALTPFSVPSFAKPGLLSLGFFTPPAARTHTPLFFLVSHCCPDWPWTCSIPSASAWVLRLMWAGCCAMNRVQSLTYTKHTPAFVSNLFNNDYDKKMVSSCLTNSFPPWLTSRSRMCSIASYFL